MKVNKTLIYLNLYNCGLTDIAGEKIFKAIENNKSLIINNQLVISNIQISTYKILIIDTQWIFNWLVFITF